MNKVIGSVTTYHGTEHPYLRGYQVQIVAVLHNGAMPEDEHGEIPGYEHIDDDGDLARAGGVTVHDRIEVQPWIESKGRFSFVSSDPLASDLACFTGIR